MLNLLKKTMKFKFIKKTMKYRAFYKRNRDDSKNILGTFNTIEEAAKKCQERAGTEESFDSLIRRKYYMVGYGPSMVGIEEF